MDDPVAQALALWGMAEARAEFVAGRENRVYRVRTEASDYALRIRRPGYRSDAEIRSELEWLAAMARAGMQVPLPRRALSGALVETVEGRAVDVIGWLDGQPMGRTGAPLALEDPVAVLQRLGGELARLHAACDAWQPPGGFARARWDRDGLLGDAPLWGRFWDNPTLDVETRVVFVRFRDAARVALDEIGATQDFGLIHADPVRENVLMEGDRLHLIDFDDGGYGFRLFDLATALIKNRDEPEYPAMEAALIAGYREVRALGTDALPLFLAIRAASYVGWIAPRLGEAGAQARNARLVGQARDICAAWLLGN